MGFRVRCLKGRVLVCEDEKLLMDVGLTTVLQCNSYNATQPLKMVKMVNSKIF